MYLQGRTFWSYAKFYNMWCPKNRPGKSQRHCATDTYMPTDLAGKLVPPVECKAFRMLLSLNCKNNSYLRGIYIDIKRIIKVSCVFECSHTYSNGDHKTFFLKIQSATCSFNYHSYCQYFYVSGNLESFKLHSKSKWSPTIKKTQVQGVTYLFWHRSYA